MKTKQEKKEPKKDPLLELFEYILKYSEKHPEKLEAFLIKNKIITPDGKWIFPKENDV